MNLGYSLPKRRELLAKLPEGRPVAQEPMDFQGSRSSWPVYLVSIDLPRYRLKNGRTLAAQEDLIARDSKLPRNLFQDPESDLAQREQHKLLLALSKAGPLWQEMSKGTQKEPIVLNRDGYVINGNRRLCAMREMLERDGTRYSSYRNIRAVVFPDADDQQVYEFEVKEQIRTDVKDEYDWIQTAKMLRRGMDELNLTEKRLAEIYETPPQRIRELIQLLNAADEYLADRGKPNQYNLVLETEFAFKKILQSRKKVDSESDRDTFTSLSYIMMENPKGAGRLYDSIPELQENLEPIVKAIQSEVDLPVAETSGSSEAVELLGGSNPNVAASIDRAAQDSTKRQAILDVISDQLEEARSRARSRESADYTIRKVRQASTFLLDAKNGVGPDSRTDGLEQHLHSIEESVAYLRNHLRKHP